MLIAGQSLSEDEARVVFDSMLTGELPETVIAAVLSLLAAKGPTVDELTGAARVMRAHVTAVPFTPGDDERLIDTCGTGGAPKTFNISTAAAIVAASVRADRRVVVAKHGNRSRTGRGSAEVLEALGVQVNASPEVQARCLAEAGVCFCFAIHHHPAMRHAGPVRRALGVPTIFNTLGPLTNPAGAQRQVIGVYDAALVPLLTQTLERLGAARALVVHGDDGLDEATLTTTSSAMMLSEGAIKAEKIDPRSVGLSLCALEALKADSVEAAAGIVRSVLDGEGGPTRDITLLNAALALEVAGVVEETREGIELAAEAIDSGRARSTLEVLARVSADAS